ncbi:MAG: hypothetical protein NT007_13530 [Candidatus Kapabacteria bacterium]|nr:hypothetical protein [Candidatus Kapabacteria bacterium]
MMIVETSNWEKFGQSDNAEFFIIEESILSIVPFSKCTDDENTATQSVNIQLDFLRKEGKSAAIIIFMDNIVQQTSAARAIYRELPDPEVQLAYALVGGTNFGRAVASVFLGISKPKVPTKMFANFEQAINWCHSIIKTK